MANVVSVEAVIVTPDMAEKLLEKSRQNRKFSEVCVERLTQEILRNQSEKRDQS